MAEFRGLGLVEIDTVPSEHGEEQYHIRLAEEFSWFLTEKFSNLKEASEH